MGAREVELLERLLSGSRFLASAYDTDIDIAVPKQFLITTGTKKCEMVIRMRGPAAAIAALKKGVVIGSGGGFSVGTPLVINQRDLADDRTPSTGFSIGEDYIVGSGGGASAGTTVTTEYHFPNVETRIALKLEAGTVYGLVFTSIADNNSAVFDFEFDE